VTETLAPDVVRVPVAPLGIGNAYLLGDVLVDAGFPWSRKKIAGPGSLAYWRSSDRVLVVGDAAWHILPGRASTIPAGFGHDQQATRRSLERLVALDPHVVAFGHGQPLRNPAEVERAFG
jgi:hypothetical protein